jgi:1,2-diacylglycerol 3-alpha-glucosyltransferase
MRVALVIAGPYPALRGSQVLVSHLARGLGARGHDVRVVTYGERRGQRPGARPTRVLLDAVLVARLWRVARRARVDVIHAHNYEAAIAGLLVGRALGRPLVYHGHSALE